MTKHTDRQREQERRPMRAAHQDTEQEHRPRQQRPSRRHRQRWKPPSDESGAPGHRAATMATDESGDHHSRIDRRTEQEHRAATITEAAHRPTVCNGGHLRAMRAAHPPTSPHRPRQQRPSRRHRQRWKPPSDESGTPGHRAATMATDESGDHHSRIDRRTEQEHRAATITGNS